MFKGSKNEAGTHCLELSIAGEYRQLVDASVTRSQRVRSLVPGRRVPGYHQHDMR